LKKSFTISHEDEVLHNPSDLMAEVLKETGSQAQAESIVRSLQRIGSDPSILFYEMTLETRVGRLGGVGSSAWRVRADRGRPAVVDSPEQPPAR
jgi:uncharacterized protein involved in type VI secretion and phage assembly